MKRIPIKHNKPIRFTASLHIDAAGTNIVCKSRTENIKTVPQFFNTLARKVAIA